MENLKQRIGLRLERIVNILMLNASFTDNLGLLNVKKLFELIDAKYYNHSFNIDFKRPFRERKAIAYILLFKC
jgi:hypothetical protein